MKKILTIITLTILMTILVACTNDKETFLITFDSAGGSNVSTQKVEKNDKVTKPTDPYQIGYFFDSWSLDDEVFDFDTLITKDITLLATWINGTNEDGTVTITFDTDGGSEIDNVFIDQNTKLNTPTDPIKIGYDFIGWYYNDKPFDFGKPVLNHITIKAVWEVNTDIVDEDGNSYALLPDGTLTLVKGVSKDTVVIKDEVNDFKVSQISYEAFKDTTINNLTINDNITKIEFKAFENCAISNLTIPFSGDGESFTHFGYIFGAKTYNYNSTFVPSSLKNLTITNAQTLYKNDFYNCFNISDIEVSDNTINIEQGAFYACNSLFKITLPFLGDGYDITHFAHIFGASDYTQNNTFTPNSLKEVLIYNATTVWEYGFANCANIEKITLPDLEEIKSYAFYGCSNLLTFDIPEMQEIKSYTFANCVSLNNITIPTSIKTIKEAAFQNTTSLQTITLVDVLSIELNAFNNSGLKSFVIESNTIIGEYAFSNCLNLNSIDMELVEIIKEGAFSNCILLNTVVMPNNVLIIEEKVFENCSKLSNIVLNNVSEIKENAFKNCISIKTLDIDAVISLGAFEGCINLEEITLSDLDTHFGYLFGAKSASTNHEYVPTSIKNVVITQATTITVNAFFGCTNIVNVILPNTLEKIESGIFVECTKLESITVPFLGDVLNSSNAYLGYFFQTYGDESNIGVVNSLKNINILNAIEIKENAFKGCSYIQNIIFPNTVTSFGVSAFEGCSSLQSIDILEVEVLESNLFKDCTSLTSLNLQHVTILKTGSLENTSITNINLVGITVENGALKGCAVTNITFDTMVNNLGYVFGVENNLIPSTLKTVNVTNDDTIATNTFKDSSNITTINYTNLLSVDNGAFENCSSLVSIDISNLQIIESNTFKNCTSLTSITLSSSLQTIKESAFEGCLNMRNITIPSSVNIIEINAFNLCSNLTITVNSVKNNWIGFIYNNDLECYEYEDNQEITIIII